MRWKYYLDTSIFNLGLSAIVGAYTDMLYAIATFATIGTLVGFIAFAYFKEQEYYFYANFGYSKWMLIKWVWIINLLIVVVLLGIYTFIRAVIL